MTSRWSASRLAVGLVLALWAVLFWFLLLTDRTGLYLSRRVEWVVPVGAIVLTIAAVGRVATAGSDRKEPVSGRRAIALVTVILPALSVLLLPPASLGAYAASRQTLSAGYASSTPDLDSGRITLANVAAAMWSKEGARALAEKAGAPVSFVGFVARRDGTPADEFILTRFLVSCCLADALSVQVRVVGAAPGRYEEDQWVRVSGALYPVGREVLVDASKIRSVPRPQDPYLSA